MMKNFDAIIEKILEMLDDGREQKEILRAFPEFHKEVLEIFSIIDGAEKAKRSIVPSQELTKKILAAINPSCPFSIFKFRFAIPVGAAILAAATLVIFAGKQKPSPITKDTPKIETNGMVEVVSESAVETSPVAEVSPIAEKESERKDIAIVPFPGATADSEVIDFTVNNILAALAEEQSVQSGETNDSYFAESDPLSDDFEQLFNYNEI